MLFIITKMHEFDETFINRMLGLPPPVAIREYIRQTLNDPDIFRVDELKEDVKNRKYHGDFLKDGDVLAHYLSDINLTSFRIACCLIYADENYDKYPEFIAAMREVIADELDESVEEIIRLDHNYIGVGFDRYTNECKLLAIWLFTTFEDIIDSNDNSYFE